MRRPGMKFLEGAGFFGVVALFCFSTVVYVADIPLIRTYFFGLEDSSRSEEVAKLLDVKGGVRRQLVSESEFKAVPQGSALYNFDTIMTGPETTASILLADGGRIELSALTMIKLTFDSGLSLGGISRAPKLVLVSGQVKGVGTKRDITVQTNKGVISLKKDKPQEIRVAPEAPKIITPIKVVPVAAAVPSLPVAPPPPPPVKLPPKIVIVSPAEETVLNVPKGRGSPQVPALFKWTQDQPDVPIKFVLRKTLDGVPGDPLKTVVTRTSQVDAILTSPGNYIWELLEESSVGAPLKVARFDVQPEFDGIEILSPLVGGSAITDNKLVDKLVKEFSVTFRWKPLPGVKQYVVAVLSRGEGGKVLMEKTTTAPELTFNRNKILTNKVFYRVSGKVPSGFLATSKTEVFSFNFLSPRQMLPMDNSVVPQGKAGLKKKTLLFTWQKTNFTEEYEIEVGTDREITRPVIQKKLKDNFFVIDIPEKGAYWWRVISHSETATSPKGPAYSFQVQ